MIDRESGHPQSDFQLSRRKLFKFSLSASAALLLSSTALTGISHAVDGCSGTKCDPQTPALPCPEAKGTAPYRAGIALGAFLFENPHNLSSYDLEANSRLVAPIPSRWFRLSTYLDGNYSQAEAIHDFIVEPEGTGWGVSKNGSFLTQSENGRHYFLYRRTGAGNVLREGDNRRTQKRGLLPVVPYIVERLTSTGAVAEQTINGKKILQRYQDFAYLCEECEPLIIDEFTLNRRLDLYPVQDFIPARKGQLVAPRPEFLKQRLPVGA